MTPQAFLREAAKRGLIIVPDGDHLRCIGAKEVLTPKVIAYMRAHKAELLRLLAEDQPGGIGSEKCACGRLVWRYDRYGRPYCEACWPNGKKEAAD